MKLVSRFGSAWVALYTKRHCFSEACKLIDAPSVGLVCLIEEHSGGIHGMRLLKTRDGLAGIEGAYIKRAEWTSVIAFCTSEIRMTKGAIAALALKIGDLSDRFKMPQGLADIVEKREAGESRTVSDAFDSFVLCLSALGLYVSEEDAACDKPKELGLNAFSEPLEGWAMSEVSDCTRVGCASEAVAEMMGASRISSRRLSMRMGKASSYIGLVLHRESGDMQVETLGKIAETMGYELVLKSRTETIGFNSWL